MLKNKNKAHVKPGNRNITRLAHKYTSLKKQLNTIKKEHDTTLNALRDNVLALFAPEDENKTRVAETKTIQVTVNKRTIRKTKKINMEDVFKDISETYRISREDLDTIIDSNTTVSEIEVKPAVKVTEQ